MEYNGTIYTSAFTSPSWFIKLWIVVPFLIQGRPAGSYERHRTSSGGRSGRPYSFATLDSMWPRRWQNNHRFCS